MNDLFKLHPKPWRYVKIMDFNDHCCPVRNDTPATEEELVQLAGGYGRLSNGILDANNKCVILCDPSEGEYSWAMRELSAIALVDFVNNHAPVRIPS